MLLGASVAVGTAVAVGGSEVIVGSGIFSVFCAGVAAGKAVRAGAAQAVTSKTDSKMNNLDHFKGILQKRQTKTIIIQEMSLSRPFKILLVAATAALLLVWIIKTPPGLLGKIDAIGYAVCHQAPARSFLIGERPTPLCARCSGMYLGALAGMAFLFTLGRRGDIPPLKIGVVLILFVVAFGIDGVNSFAHLIPGIPFVYQSQNGLRLITGTGMGLGIAAVLVPVFNQAVWIDYTDTPALGKWRDLAILLIVGVTVSLGIYTQNPLIIYPLAVLSGLGVMVILTLVYTIIWVLFSKTENRYHKIQQLWIPLTLGFLTALLQISVIDAGRFILTKTWAGLPLPN